MASENGGTPDRFSELLHTLRGDLLAEMPAAKVVVSAGCAGSWYFQWFDEKYPFEIDRHIGFDTEQAPPDLPENVEWHQSSMANMAPVADESADLVFAGQAIEHISIADCVSFLQHAHRLLKPGGWLVMDSPNFTITGPSKYLHPEHVIEYTTEQMREILQAAGFRVVSAKGILLCRENGRVLDSPLDIETINDRRIKAAKERPEDSFIWWIEASRNGEFDSQRVSRLLTKIDRTYEEQRATFAGTKQAARKAEDKVPGRLAERGGQRIAKMTKSPVGVVRQVIRRVTPWRLRWFVRSTFRFVTGLYFRDIARQMQSAAAQISGHGAEVEAQGEVLSLMVSRLRRLEDTSVDLITHLERQEGLLDERLAILSQPLPEELSSKTIGVLNYDRSHRGFRSRFNLWLNEPIIIEYTPADVRWALTVERIAEIPFVLQAVSALSPPARILDIGACESLIPLELASLGYKVTALDIRPYAFMHPNLTAVQADILTWAGDGAPYDAVILLSTVEHFGLPVYGQTNIDADADRRAMDRVRSLLRTGGLLVLTTPFGPSAVGPTERTYSASDLSQLLDGFTVQHCRVAHRQDDRTWIVDARTTLGELHNAETQGEDAAVLISAVKG